MSQTVGKDVRMLYCGNDRKTHEVSSKEKTRLKPEILSKAKNPPLKRDLGEVSSR